MDCACPCAAAAAHKLTWSVCLPVLLLPTNSHTVCRSLFPGIGPDGSLPKDPEDLPFDLAVAVNKFDLLPTQATRQRVQQWVRAR